jgi:hypothetical protein
MVNYKSVISTALSAILAVGPMGAPRAQDIESLETSVPADAYSLKEAYDGLKERAKTAETERNEARDLAEGYKSEITQLEGRLFGTDVPYTVEKVCTSSDSNGAALRYDFLDYLGGKHSEFYEGWNEEVEQILATGDDTTATLVSRLQTRVTREQRGRELLKEKTGLDSTLTVERDEFYNSLDSNATNRLVEILDNSNLTDEQRNKELIAAIPDYVADRRKAREDYSENVPDEFKDELAEYDKIEERNDAVLLALVPGWTDNKAALITTVAGVTAALIGGGWYFFGPKGSGDNPAQVVDDGKVTGGPINGGSIGE